MHKPITLFLGLLCASHAALTQQVQPQPWSKASSFETSGQAPPLFPAQHQVVQGNPLYTRTGNQSVLLNARQGNAYLLSEALPVHKGEVLHLEAHAHYLGKANSKPLAKLATAVAATSAVAILSNATKSNGNGDTRLTQSKLPFLSLGVALPTALIASYRKVPRAYLQYALYDKEGKLVRSQAIAVQKAAKSNWQALQASELVEQDGFVRVGLVNESKTDVWFDDVALSTAANGRIVGNAGGGVVKNDMPCFECGDRGDNGPIDGGTLPEVPIYPHRHYRRLPFLIFLPISVEAEAITREDKWARRR